MTDLPPSNDSPAKGIAALPAQAVETVRETAAKTARRTVDTIEGNPLSVLVGGLAVGVLAGALLPKTEREDDLLKPVGKRITQGAGMAVKAARDAGLSELAAAGISREAARQQIRKLMDGVAGAAKTAGDAAAKAARTQDKAAPAPDAPEGETSPI